MAYTVSHFIVDRLHAWGVRRVFGYPGDGINGVIGALAEAADKIEFIEPRHEEMAAFMASGHAKLTGGLGVCLSTAGPGAVHLLNGLYDAKADHQPVVAIVGQQARSALGSQYQQEIDLAALFKDVASEYVQMITTATQARHVVDRARAHRALATLSHVHHRSVGRAGAGVRAAAAQAPHDSLGRGIRRTARRSHRTDACRCGAHPERRRARSDPRRRGAAGAREEVLQVAEVLGAGIAKALLGKHVIPDEVATSQAPSASSARGPPTK
jgi:pyruvate dehydrogenase (quinone)